MTSALVTGSTGFVGSFLVEELLANGRDVSCVIRQSSDLQWLRDQPVNFIRWDLVNGSPPVKQIEGIDEVYHVAGLTTASQEEAFYRVNRDAVRNLIDALHEANVTPERFLLVSSLAAAGPSVDRTPRTEDEPCEPVSHYGKSKREGEIVLQRNAGDIPYTIIRPPVVIGPRDEMVLDMVEMVTNGVVPKFGRYKTYSFIFVLDLVRGILEAVESDEAVDETFFLSHPETVTWTSFMQHIGDALDMDPMMLSLPDTMASLIAGLSERLGGLPGVKESFTRDKAVELQQPSWVCTADKAKKAFGFEAEYDFASTAELTIEWYQQHGWIPAS
jgi:nucleoside-diphosphate-sugar epimerase